MRTSKKIVKWLGITVLSIILFIIALAVGVRIAVSIPSVQEWIKNEAITALQDKMQTNITIRKVSIDFWRKQVEIYDLHIDDRQGQPMLDLGMLEASMSVVEPLDHRYVVKDILCKDIRANIYKEKKDSAANYQFIIDAFKKKTPKKKKNKTNIFFDINKVKIANVDVHYDLKWKKMENNISLDRLTYHIGKDDVRYVQIDSIAYQSNNHKPHKRVGHPNKGYFDAGHMNMTANVTLTYKQLAKDSFLIDLKQFEAYDKPSHLSIDTLRCQIRTSKKQLHVSDIYIRDGKTKVSIPQLTVTLPKKKGGEVYLKTPEISAYAVLKDISHPFAPKLKNFTTPILVKAPMEGYVSDLYIKKAIIRTPDNRIRSTATARLMKLAKKDSMRIEIYVPRFKAVNGIKEQIVHHFKTMKSMDGLLEKAGNITVTNTNIVIVRKKQFFRGRLYTAVGHCDFDMGLNGWTRYMHATVSSPQINLGALAGKKSVGVISFDATMDIDICGKRMAKIIGRHHGKLPAGTIKGTINEVFYQKFVLRNVDFDITCDGDTAKGFVDRSGKYIDLDFEFSFTNTRFEKSLKFHPKIKIHKKDKALAVKIKEVKAREKAERKAQKQAAKAAKKAQKALKAQKATKKGSSFGKKSYAANY